MPYDHQWTLIGNPIAYKLLSESFIKSINPPYLLDPKYRYTFYLLKDISRVIKELRIENNNEEYQLVSCSEMDRIDDNTMLNIGDSFIENPSIRLNILNSKEMRSIEKSMIFLHNSIMQKSEEFDRHFKTVTIERREPFNENWRDVKATLFGIKWKKIPNIGHLKSKIFGIFSDTPPFYNEYAHTYIRKEDFEDTEKFVVSIENQVTSWIRKYENNKIIYLDKFKIFDFDSLSDDHIVIEIEGSKKRLFTSESLKYVSARIKIIRENRERESLINLFHVSLPGQKIQIGGDTYLYYIKVKYKNREKPFYKIGITQRKLQERYSGKEFEKISKVLFFDRVVNALEIESAIKLQFANHSIPLDFFRGADGKTEFFDIDVLGLDR